MTFKTHHRLLVALALALAAPVALADYQIKCESNGNRYQYCNANTSGKVRLVQQMSSSNCRQGRDWGYDWNGVWVSNGCRARFQVGGKNTGGGGNNNNNNRNDAGTAVAVAGGLAILGAIIASSDNDNRPAPPPQPQPYYSGVPPWGVGSFYGQDPYNGAWQTISIDPNGGVVRYVNGYPPAYGSFANGALYINGQTLPLQPAGGGVMIANAFYRRQ
jgi:hypothetical protein